MIMIFDNGQPYSLHKIYFVDINNIPIKTIESLFAKSPTRNPYIVATCDSIEWRNSETCMSFVDFVDDMKYFFRHAENCKSIDNEKFDFDGEKCDCWISELYTLGK